MLQYIRQASGLRLNQQNQPWSQMNATTEDTTAYRQNPTCTMLANLPVQSSLSRQEAKSMI